jgi:dienelactone hydrolase
MEAVMIRMSFVAALCAVFAAPALGAGLPHVTVPPLAGGAAVGTVSLHLVDSARRDPSSPSGKRELMVQLWYPAAATAGYPLAPYMTPRTAAFVEHVDHAPAGLIASVRTRAHTGAPVAAGKHAVVLFSPGSGGLRSGDTALVEDLASAGYVVAAIDHTHEASVVEFPGGRLVRGTFVDTGAASNTRAVAIRVADVRFVIDRLARLATQGRFRGRLDVGRVGMFGFSLGGATAAAAMRVDPRIAAGADLDGSIYGPVAREGLARPFLLMLTPPDLRFDPSIRSLWSHLTGPRIALTFAHSQHESFDDLVWVKPQLARALPALARQIDDVGTIDASFAVRAESGDLIAFFDRYLRGRAGKLPSYPGVTELSSSGK